MMIQDLEKLEKAAFILKAIAHPVRLRIVDILDEHEEMSVSEICEKVDCEQAMTSHHLSNLKLKGLLQARREGKNIYYSLKERNITKVLDCIAECDCNF